MNILGYIFSVLLVTASLLTLSGHLTARCSGPDWFSKATICHAKLYIPN